MQLVETAAPNADGFPVRWSGTPVFAVRADLPVEQLVTEIGDMLGRIDSLTWALAVEMDEAGSKTGQRQVDTMQMLVGTTEAMLAALRAQLEHQRAVAK